MISLLVGLGVVVGIVLAITIIGIPTYWIMDREWPWDDGYNFIESFGMFFGAGFIGCFFILLTAGVISALVAIGNSVLGV